MKKLIALMAVAGMFAVGCKSDRENRGGTSDSNYSTSDTSMGKMQDNGNQPSQGNNTSTNSSTTQPQQP